MRSIMLPAPYPSQLCGTHMTLLGLARGGVYLALVVTNQAVRSYRTFSPLPVIESRNSPSIGGSFSVALSLIPSCTLASLLRRVGVTHHRFLSCSDFPPGTDESVTSDHLASSLNNTQSHCSGFASKRTDLRVESGYV